MCVGVERGAVGSAFRERRKLGQKRAATSMTRLMGRFVARLYGRSVKVDPSRAAS